ncbi:HAD-superhydrolase, subIA, variant 3 family protein [Candidatus Desulfosporosinus infrequens]|uniref:HAD-superhydrolase, subIA, variant 3 family protein n=1 Tax=Candidatus Desulfosporosinus infrequens TaxID=2043169 RepID=A0A2U3K6Z2_9FIRM|nr:HAD-superhydrolase, subIA, variant 3 family protein [Candidatus Desulfosporosinus infrequens]
MIRAAIFDLDELIIDLERIHKAAERQICSDYGHSFDTLSENLRFNSSGLRENDILERIKQELKLSAPLSDMVLRKQTLFSSMIIDQVLQPMPGALEAIRVLKAHGYRLALTSSGSRPRVEIVLKGLGILDSFDITVCGEDVRQGKPNPEPYRLTAERLEISPFEGVVFEDADVGIQSAKAAGLWCIGVPNPAAATRQTLKLADLVLPDLTHFTLNLLDRIGLSFD